MKLASLSLAILVLSSACSNPSPACPTPGESFCGETCVNLQSDAKNCGVCGTLCGSQQTCQAGKCSSSVCVQPDVYATCWVGGGVVGICSDTGAQTPTAIVAPPLGDGGSGEAVVPNLMGGVFSGENILWLLDNMNNQIDVVNVASWPPTIVAGIPAASGDSTFSVTQLSSCDGMVIALRTGTPSLEGYDTGTFTLTNEISLASDAGYQSPAVVACDGDHTAYVTDSTNNTVAAIDLDSFMVTALTSLPASDQPAALSDGGLVSAWVSAVGFASAAGGGEVVVALQNLGPSYSAVYPSTTFELDPALANWSGAIDPGAQCLDVFQIAISPDQSTAYLACAGIFDTANATSVQPYNPYGYVGAVDVAGKTAGAPITTTLSNPTSLAFLGNGLLAIGDYTSQSEVAFYNPADGGISYVNVNCPLLPDGGLNPQQGITGLVAAP